MEKKEEMLRAEGGFYTLPTSALFPHPKFTGYDSKDSISIMISSQPSLTTTTLYRSRRFVLPTVI
jgi:hypothetical protein